MIQALSCIILLAVSSDKIFADNVSPRITLNMNTDWAFYRGDAVDGEQPGLDDTDWMPATIPHIMQLEKKHCGGNAIYQGIGWYRRYFKLPESYKGKRITVSFEGVMTSCDVFLNGKKVKDNYGGYIGFVADITDLIDFNGNNLLAIRVSAEYDPLTPPGKPQGKMDFYYYSGIYRDVNMVITDKLHISDAVDEGITAGGGVFITYPEVSKEQAHIHVKTHLKNEHKDDYSGKLVTRLLDKSGKEVAFVTKDICLPNSSAFSFEQDLIVRNPQLWHPYSPELYVLQSQVVVKGKVIDECLNHIGIRTIKYTTEDGFFINGEKLYLRGANRHQGFQNVGDAASNSMQEREVIQLKQGGFNAVRAAHYPQDPAFLDACDKYGLLVIECIPSWQYFNKDSVFIKRLYEVGREMIRRDRNRPSVILWETALNESRYPVELAKDIYTIAHEEYPGDQMYTSGDYFGNAAMKDYYDVFYKQVDKFPRDGDVMSNYWEDQIAVKPLLTREWGDGVGEKPQVAMTENEEELMKQSRSRIFQMNGNGYFDWCYMDANPRMGGHFVWSYNDYARGCCDETLYCGIVDINRYPKFSYYMFQSMRDKSINQPGLYDGPMVFIASYNASPAFSSSTTNITVYSNCDEVKLYRNGKLIGRQTREERTAEFSYIVQKGGSPSFVFDAKNYEAGTLKAEALIKGKVVATHEVRTPGAPHHIEVDVHCNSVLPVADGSDMIPVYFKVCDESGTVVNSSDVEITIAVSGQGSLIGEGIKRIGVSPQQVEGGIGFAFIRTTKESGRIHISAKAENIKEGEAEIITLPFKGNLVQDGNHRIFSGDEENGVVNPEESQEKHILAKKPVEIEYVETSSDQQGYPASNLNDGNDKTWWIAGSEELPQTIVVSLKELTYVCGSRILFQKDSSSYKHKVEVSSDGKSWEILYDRECTGWDFKPVPIGKKIKYFKITINSVSEGRAGIGEITLYGD